MPPARYRIRPGNSRFQLIRTGGSGNDPVRPIENIYSYNCILVQWRRRAGMAFQDCFRARPIPASVDSGGSSKIISHLYTDIYRNIVGAGARNGLPERFVAGNGGSVSPVFPRR
jgi:hypothetical protein